MRWWLPLGLLAAIRVAIPLAAFADEGSRLPGMPAFFRFPHDGGLTGDATGFYAATREFMAAWGRMPRLVGLIAGHDAWRNGQWEVDVGLHNYSEPLSTLLVTAGAALVLSPQLTQLRLAAAGCALSAATLVKVSNALLAAAALVVVFL